MALKVPGPFAETQNDKMPQILNLTEIGKMVTLIRLVHFLHVDHVEFWLKLIAIVPVGTVRYLQAPSLPTPRSHAVHWKINVKFSGRCKQCSTLRWPGPGLDQVEFQIKLGVLGNIAFVLLCAKVMSNGEGVTPVFF